MKVIYDAVDGKKVRQSESRIIECSECRSLFSLTKDEAFIADYGCAFAMCPVCSTLTYTNVDEWCKDVTSENVEFPVDFAGSCEFEKITDDDAREITQNIKDLVEVSIKTDDIAYLAGRKLVVVCPEDDGHRVFVAPSYFETYLDD